MNKLLLALELHEIDEAVIDRQRPLWLKDLARAAHAARMGPVSNVGPQQMLVAVTPVGQRGRQRQTEPDPDDDDED